MKLPDSSRFVLCRCSDGSPQRLTVDCDKSLLSGFLGYDPDARRFVEVVFSHPGRIQKTLVKFSLPQRIETAARVKHPNIATILETGMLTAKDYENAETDGQEPGPYYVAEFVEGERLPEYLERCRSLNKQISTSLVLQLADVISALVDHPRLLSSVTLDDFAVSLEQGQYLRLRLTDFGFERDEEPGGDLELAAQWIRAIGSIHHRILNGRSMPTKLEDSDSTFPCGSPFGRLLKRIENLSGSAAVRTLKGIKAQVMAASGLSDAAGNHLTPEFRSISKDSECPIGPLQRLLRGGEEFKEMVEEKFELEGQDDSPGLSPFQIPARLPAKDGEEKADLDSAKRRESRVTLHILPPERLLEHNGMQTLNEKMRDPYLKKHPCAVRTRSLYCETDFSIVVSERLSGFPLPVLLANKGRLEPIDAIDVLWQIDRALTHFECSDFEFSDFHPWQIELHFRKETPDQIRKFLTRAPVSNWPAWEAKLRVERPTEAFTESSHSPWRHLFDRVDRKAFPALAVWLMESDRFEWALTTGNEDREPLSWNPQFNQLIEAAIGFYDPANPRHRKRMIDLIAEIFGTEKLSRSGSDQPRTRTAHSPARLRDSGENSPAIHDTAASLPDQRRSACD
ncbi:MAG: hypothetical protein HKN23_00375 [Verrucomicrobiales bacterium]|nr:hypothetical protein [Verrucomicrobiales bacterium]